MSDQPAAAESGAPPAAAGPALPDGRPHPAPAPRKVLFVAGTGRSGTSTLAGLMRILGLHVPQPEVLADVSNPKGFGEPLWAVENHDRLLALAGVQVGDARPDAWVETARLSDLEPERLRATRWLEKHLAVNPELVVKDPRLSWFLPLWRAAAVRSGATPAFVTMLRPPGEVVASRTAYYRGRLGPAHLTASWLNVLLHTEHATREQDGDGGRAFVRYADLLEDWASTLTRVGEQLGLEHVRRADGDAIRRGDRFVDPGLRRMTQTLDELDLPRRLRELAAEAWVEVDRLAEPGGDGPRVREALDQLRTSYVELYDESAAIAQSSVVAAEHRLRQRLAGPDAQRDRRSPAFAADRVPHRLRAAVPGPLRRGLRRALGRPRP